MTAAGENPFEQLLNERIEELRGEGWSVLRQPDPQDLPEPLSRNLVRVDFVARRGDEILFGEVASRGMPDGSISMPLPSRSPPFPARAWRCTGPGRHTLAAPTPTMCAAISARRTRSPAPARRRRCSWHSPPLRALSPSSRGRRHLPGAHALADAR